MVSKDIPAQAALNLGRPRRSILPHKQKSDTLRSAAPGLRSLQEWKGGCEEDDMLEGEYRVKGSKTIQKLDHIGVVLSRMEMAGPHWIALQSPSHQDDSVLQLHL